MDSQAHTSKKSHDQTPPASQTSAGAAPVQGGGALDGLTKLLASNPTQAQVAAYVGKQSSADQKTLLTWMQTAPGLGSSYAAAVGKLLTAPAAATATPAPTATGTTTTKIPAPAETATTTTTAAATPTGTTAPTTTKATTTKAAGGTTTKGTTTASGTTTTASKGTTGTTATGDGSTTKAAPVLGTTAATTGDVSTGDYNASITSTGTSASGTASFGEKITDPSVIDTSGSSTSSSSSSTSSSTTTTAPKTPTTTLTGAASGSVTIGKAKISGSETVTDKEGVLSDKGTVGVAAGNTTVTADGGSAQGTKAEENGGLQVVQKIGDDTITGGVEIQNNDAQTTTKGTGKSAKTTTTPDSTAVTLNGGFKNKTVNVTGTGGFNSVTDDVNAGANVTVGKVTGGATYDNLAGDTTLGFSGSYAGTDATVSDTFTDDLGKHKITDTGTVKINKGDLAGDTISQGVTDNAGDFSSTGKLGIEIGAGGKHGTANISGTADYGKNTYGGTVGYTAPTTGTFAGSSIAATGSIDPTAGITQGVNTRYNHTMANGAALSASNQLNYFATGQPTNDVGNIDYHHSVSKTDNVDVGAEVQVGKNGIGYAADVYAGDTHLEKNGSSVTGMAAAGVSDGVPFAGVGGGWDSKAVDVDGQPKWSIHGAAMMGALGPVAGVAGEIDGKVRFKIVMQDLQVVELSVSIPGKHPVLNAALSVGTTAAMIALDGVGFAISGLEKLFGRGHIPGIDRLLQMVHGDKSAKITDANGTTDSAAAAALSKGAAILTEQDLEALKDMHMLDASGNIDGTIAMDLFVARLNESPLDATQKGAITIAYKAASQGKKQGKTSKKSGVSDVAKEISANNTDVNQFAALLEKYPRDWTPMLQEIAEADHYGIAFANQTAKAAGILDQVVVGPDGKVNFTLPLPSAVVKPNTPPAPTAAPATTPAEITQPGTDEDSGQLTQQDIF